MSTIFSDMAQVLLRRQVWGPFLILVGAYLIFSIGIHPISEDKLIAYVKPVLAIVLILGGILMMFVQLRSDEVLVASPDSERVLSEPEYAMTQLSKNYDLLRRQTTQGFILSGVFMALGLLVILSGSAGEMFGFTKEGSNLTTVAGIIMEFISATALFVYRMNFSRLNQATDRIDSAWRVLTANNLAKTLPDDRRAEATMKLIDALLLSHHNDSSKASQPSARTRHKAARS